MSIRRRSWQPLRGARRLPFFRSLDRMVLAWLAIVCAAGCGTTRWSDTSRTATEQMLLSDAIDRAISQIDFSTLAGHSIYIDNKYINGEVDDRYLVSTLRQHMMASGCAIRDKVDDATCVLEIRSGAVGTNRSDLLFGVPATTLPTGGALTGIPSTIPEIPLVKRTAQQGVCKIAVFAYDRGSGRPLWQSGTRQVASQTKDVWIFGAGPFTRGSIHDGTHLAGEQLAKKKSRAKDDSVWVAHEILFPEPPLLAQRTPSGVTQASANVSTNTSPGTDGQTTPAAGTNASGSSTIPGGGGGNGAGSGTTTGGAASGSGSAAGAGGSSTLGTSNPVAGAVGAMDWAQTMLGNNHVSPTSPTTATQAPAPLQPQTPLVPGQIPAVLRPKGL